MYSIFFAGLLTISSQLHAYCAKEYSPVKEQTSYSDSLDALRLAYKMCKMTELVMVIGNTIK